MSAMDCDIKALPSYLRLRWSDLSENPDTVFRCVAPLPLALGEASTKEILMQQNGIKVKFAAEASAYQTAKVWLYSNKDEDDQDEDDQPRLESVPHMCSWCPGAAEDGAAQGGAWFCVTESGDILGYGGQLVLLKLCCLPENFELKTCAWAACNACYLQDYRGTYEDTAPCDTCAHPGHIAQDQDLDM